MRDGYRTPAGRPAEAGQHGFWAEYNNIFSLIDSLNLPEDPLTGYDEQGQYSPNGSARRRGQPPAWAQFWRNSAQFCCCVTALQVQQGVAAAHRPRPGAVHAVPQPEALDLASAAALVLAFSEFDDSEEAWRKYDKLSFRDLCVKLGVSKRLYDEAFEPMILTGLFAPGEQCSAAAALGMAYFFVLKHQQSLRRALVPRATLARRSSRRGSSSSRAAASASCRTPRRRL